MFGSQGDGAKGGEREVVRTYIPPMERFLGNSRQDTRVLPLDHDLINADFWRGTAREIFNIFASDVRPR